MKSFLTYTVLRLVLMVACIALTWVALHIAGVGDTAVIWSLVLGAVISSGLAWKFLAGPREEMARGIELRAERMKASFDAARAKEDVPEDRD